MRSLGFNLVRLGVLWAGVVPNARGQTNSSVLAALAAASATLFDAGIYTLLDAHQDTFSARFCDDGAPTWVANEYSAGAAGGFPEPLSAAFPVDNTTGLPSSSNCSAAGGGWFEYYLTFAAGKAFDTLYNTPMGRADFGAFWDAVVRAYAGAGALPAVLAYELLNEPWCGDALNNATLLLPGVADAAQLQPFYASVTGAIRAAEAAVGAPPHVVAMEPVTWDEFFPVGFTPGAPWEPGLSMLSCECVCVCVWC
jgi:endoglycosylceramidase